jgi:hypothetical protein
LKCELAFLRLNGSSGKEGWALRIECGKSGALIAFILSLFSTWAYASDDPCFVAYWHVDRTAELHTCEAAANAGDAEAQFGYGLILWSAQDRQNDRGAALHWFRKSARQRHHFAQSSLGLFLTDKRVDADLRNPIEGYAWLVTAGDHKLAARIRLTLDEREAGEADRLATEYSAKYGNPPSPASRWVTAGEVLLRVWPGVAVLCIAYFARRRLQRKMLFICAGGVIAYTSLFVVDWISTTMLPRAATHLIGSVNLDNLGNVVWVFWLTRGVYVLFALATPPLAAFLLSRAFLEQGTTEKPDKAPALV